MNAIELLENHHRLAEILFAHMGAYDATDERRAAVFVRLADLLDAHTAIEEQWFYPAARSDVSDDLVDKSLEVHAGITRLLDEMRELDTDSPAFDAKLSVVREHFERHIKEEEFELFPESQRFLSEERLQELGEQMAIAFRAKVGDDKRFEVAGEELDEVEAESEGLEVEFEPDTALRPHA